MRLDLKDIIHVPGASKDFQFQLDLSQLEFYGSHPISRPVEAADRDQPRRGLGADGYGPLPSGPGLRPLREGIFPGKGGAFGLPPWPMSWRTRRTTRSCSWRAARWIWTSW